MAAEPKPEPSESARAIAKAIGGEVVPLRRPPAVTARIDRTERWNVGQEFGDLRASQMAGILLRAKQGDIAEWSDLALYMLRDDIVGSLHQTRVLRVTQADYIVTPSKRGNPRLAELAADLCDGLMLRIAEWPLAMKRLLHAIAAGFAAGELAWEHDRIKRQYYVREIKFVHNHRFRFDEQWELRLYDRGSRQTPASMYGEALKPGGWIVHQHQPRADYPGTAGQLFEVAWMWLFRRWVDKFHVGGVERAGNPNPYARVPENTPQATRDQIQADLESLANGSAGVVNDNVEILALEAAAATRSWEAYTDYLEQSERRMTISYLGASDAVAPGANGSQAAVSTRVGASMDPRMVDDGASFCATVQAQIFRWYLYWNCHLLGVRFDQVDTIPLPEMRLKTADDEVKRDHSDRAQEISDEGGIVEPGQEPVAAPLVGTGGGDTSGPVVAPEGAPVQALALNGAQVTSLQEIVQAAARGELPRDSAMELIQIAFPTVTPERADKLLGSIGRGFEPTPEPAPFNPFGGKPKAAPAPGGDAPAADASEKPAADPELLADAQAALDQLDDDGPAPDPKARARATRATGPAARATSSRLPSPIALALSSGLGASGRSSPSRSSTPRKR